MIMNAAFWLSLVMAGAGCTGLILAGRGYWQGWALGLAIQPVWAVFAVVTKGYGLLITCVMYGTVYAKNLLKWRKENNKQPDLPEHHFTKVIVAGSHVQAREYMNRNNLTPRQAIVASDVTRIEGLRFRRRDVIRVGTWYNRPDLEIVEDYIARVTVLYGE